MTDEVELREYLALLWRWAWLIALCAFFAAGGAYLVSSHQEPVYQASATLLVNEATNKSLTPDLSALTLSERLARTYSELLRKRPVLERVIQELNLPMSPDALARLVTVRVVQNTQLITLDVEHTDPTLAATLANTIPRVFAQFNEEMQAERFAKAKEGLTAQMEALEKQIGEVQGLIAGLATSGSAEDQAERLRLQLWLSQLETSYSSLQRSYEDIRLAEANSLDTLTIVEPAEVPTVPIRPKTLQNVLLAAAVGLIVGAGAAFLIEYLDDTLKSPADVEKGLGLTTLGTIARFGGKSLEEKLITAQHSRSSVAEAYRILRTNLEFTAVDGDLRTILVTSPSPVEGKTVTAANLAVVMAQAGRSVILADADLRRPAVHRMFRVPNEAGLTTALVRGDDIPLTDLLQPTEVEGLRVLTSGPLPPNPAELLGSGQMARLVERLKDLADLVILDTAPALPVADPAILARVADAVLLVVDTGVTRRGMAQRATENLARAGANVAGVVLNRFSPRGSGYYYYYRYDYYYSSDGHGEGEDEEPPASGWRPLVRRHRRERSKASDSKEAGRVIKVKEDLERRSRL